MPSDYTPELSDQELKRSYWLVTHYAQLKHGYSILLVIFSSLFFLFTTWQSLSLYALGAKQDEVFLQSIKQTLNSADQMPSISDTRIESIGSRTMMEGLENGYALLFNPNQKWYLQAHLAFMRGDTEVRTVPIALEPGERRYIVGVGIPIGAPQISVVLKNVRWHFLSSNEELLIRNLSDIKVENTSFIPSDKSGISKLTPVSKVAFTLANSSLIDFWDVAVHVIAKANGSVIGAGIATINNIDAGQRKAAEVLWFVPLIAADEFDIKPLIDIVDPSVIKQRTRY